MSRPPMIPVSAPAAVDDGEEHSAPSALLSSISNFSKGGLKKTVTVDKSSGLLAVKGSSASTAARFV